MINGIDGLTQPIRGTLTRCSPVVNLKCSKMIPLMPTGPRCIPKNSLPTLTQSKITTIQLLDGKDQVRSTQARKCISRASLMHSRHMVSNRVVLGIVGSLLVQQLLLKMQLACGHWSTKTHVKITAHTEYSDTISGLKISGYPLTSTTDCQSATSTRTPKITSLRTLLADRHLAPGGCHCSRKLSRSSMATTIESWVVQAWKV